MASAPPHHSPPGFFELHRVPENAARSIQRRLSTRDTAALAVASRGTLRELRELGGPEHGLHEMRALRRKWLVDLLQQLVRHAWQAAHKGLNFNVFINHLYPKNGNGDEVERLRMLPKAWALDVSMRFGDASVTVVLFKGGRGVVLSPAELPDALQTLDVTSYLWMGFSIFGNFPGVRAHQLWDAVLVQLDEDWGYRVVRVLDYRPDRRFRDGKRLQSVQDAHLVTPTEVERLVASDDWQRDVWRHARTGPSHADLMRFLRYLNRLERQVVELATAPSPPRARSMSPPPSAPALA